MVQHQGVVPAPLLRRWTSSALLAILFQGTEPLQHLCCYITGLYCFCLCSQLFVFQTCTKCVGHLLPLLHWMFYSEKNMELILSLVVFSTYRPFFQTVPNGCSFLNSSYSAWWRSWCSLVTEGQNAISEVSEIPAFWKITMQNIHVISFCWGSFVRLCVFIELTALKLPISHFVWLWRCWSQRSVNRQVTAKCLLTFAIMYVCYGCWSYVKQCTPCSIYVAV